MMLTFWILQLILIFQDGSMHTIDLHKEYETPGECQRAKQRVTEWLMDLPAPSTTNERYLFSKLKGMTVQCFVWQKV